MNIKRAKIEIKNAIEAYLQKDDFGEYTIPAIRQRPILLMGPPGIGKHRSWNRLPESVRSHWWHIRSHTTRDRVRWGFLLLRRNVMEAENIR